MRKIILFCLITSVVFLIASCGRADDEALPYKSVSAEISSSDEVPIPDVDAAVFTSEAAFQEAILSGDYSGGWSVNGIKFYFKPSAIPEGASLMEIRVKDFYIARVYSLKDMPDTWDNCFIFEWYRTMNSGDLAADLQRTGEIAAMTESGGYFWSKAARLDENGEFKEELAVSMDIYWEQNGYAFHAVLPVSFSEEDFPVYLNAIKVAVSANTEGQTGFYRIKAL